VVEATSGVNQVEQAGIDEPVHPRRGRAGAQSQRAFPACKCNTTACAAVVARSCPISATARAKRRLLRRVSRPRWPTPPVPRRAGRAAASASAPRAAPRGVVQPHQPRGLPLASADNRRPGHPDQLGDPGVRPPRSQQHDPGALR
jgi:hypothetical protein